MLVTLFVIRTAQHLAAPDRPESILIDWSAVGAIATIVAGFATIVGVAVAVITLVNQSRALQRTLASQTYHGLVAHFNEFQRMLVDDPALRRDLFERQPKELRAARRHQLNWLLGILFNWYEDAAVQTETWKIIPDHLAQHWKRMLAKELSSPFIADYWNHYGNRFHPQLSQWVDEVRNAQTGP